MIRFDHTKLSGLLFLTLLAGCLSADDGQAVDGEIPSWIGDWDLGFDLSQGEEDGGNFTGDMGHDATDGAVDLGGGGEEDLGGGGQVDAGPGPEPGPVEPVDCDASGVDWIPDYAEFECEVLWLTNERRAQGADCDSEGVYPPAPPLEMQEDLRYAARTHSKWMMQTGIFDHDSPGGPLGDDMAERITNTGYSWSYIGENIAQGYTSPESVVQGWMDSDGHCSNIMSADFEEIGVGYVGRDNYWTQDFGTSF